MIGLAAVSLPASPLAAQEMTLRLTGVTPPSSMAGVRGPAVLFLEFDAGTAVVAKVMVPFDVVSDQYTGNGAVFDVNAAGLVLSGSSLTGTVSGAVQAAGPGVSSSLNLSLSATVNGDAVSGAYTGVMGATAISGEISGESAAETAVTGDAKVSLHLFAGEPSTPSGILTPGPGALRVWLAFAGGSLSECEASSGHYRASVYGEPDAKIVRLIGPRGDLDYALVSADNVAGASGSSGGIGPDSFSASFSVTYLGADLAGRTFAYDLIGTPIGNTLVGTYTLREGGSVLASGKGFVGYMGTGAAVAAEAMPALDPLQPSADNENTGFKPPYFAEINTASMKERIRAAALWLADCPEISVFASESTATGISATGDKQYDNGAINSYGAAVAFNVLNELSTDAHLQAFTREAAARAGYWIDARGEANYGGLATYYKDMFFVSVWGAMAHMDLYESSGDPRWLNAVIGYMTFLRNEVTTRMNGPEIRDYAPDDGVPGGRTWTMLDETSGTVGVSNARYDRSFDNYELHPAEFLWLLGKLRVDHGIQTFATFEANAYQWVLDNLNDTTTWNYRPGDPASAPRQAIGPTLFAVYMMDYAPSLNLADLNQVVGFIEANHIGWGHPVSDDGLTDDFSPYVRDYYPRQASGYLEVDTPSTAATSRMALVYLKRYQISGDPDDLEKSKAMALSVLNRQKLTSGMIHHLGVTAFSDDHQVRILLGPNGTPPDTFGNSKGRLDQHSYIGLKANTLRNLLDYADLLESLGEDCDNPQSITTAPVIQKAPLDPAFALTATATSGLPVVYELIYGPASLDGDLVTLDGTEGIVKVIASQSGDAAWCSAASRSIFIAVGDQSVATPASIAASGLDTTTVEVSWVDASDNETHFRIEYREQGATGWLTGAIAGPGSNRAPVTGLTYGTSYEFRVIAVNQVGESAPSAVVASAPLAAAVFLYAEIECGNGIGTGWEFRENPAAGGGVELYATADQRDRTLIDPATITDFHFDVPVSATYRLWVRGYTTAGGSSDSIWLKVDDGIHVGTGSDTFYSQGIFNTGSYGWQTNSSTFILAAGRHKVTICPRERGAVVDRILLTTSSDVFTSLGIGGEAFNCTLPESGPYLVLKRESGGLKLEFFGESGYLYQVETATDLAGPWDSDDSLLFTGQDAQISIPVSTPAVREFYKVYRVPVE